MDPEELSIHKKIEEVLNKGKQAHFSWLRHILTMASGLVAIIVALHTQQSNSQVQHVCFVLSVALLALGILCGSVALYSEVESHRALGFALVRELDARQSGEKRPVGVTATVPKLFKLAAYGCYLSLSLALFTLVVYASLMDAPGL